MYKKTFGIEFFSSILCRKKLFNLRKIYLLVLFIGIFSQAYPQNKRVNLNVDDTSIHDIIEMIKSQTSYSFWFDVKEVDTQKQVSVHVENKPVSDVLNSILEGQGLEVKMEGNHIVITPEKINNLPVSQQTKKISGTVTDENGEAIIGANILLKGTRTGVTTDIDGNFMIECFENAVLVVSYIGFQEREIRVGTQNHLNITLSESTFMLDELVVVGFSTQKKVNLTGAISSVDSKAFENRPVSNVGQALQGLVPNLNITMDNGSPNAVPDFNIRGGTTIDKDPNDDKKVIVHNGSPLILIDGIEGNATDVNLMNPNDIESLVTIKDASAAAIYGTRATNGVILITTKSGSYDQKAKVSYSYDLQFNTPAAIPDILDSYTQYTSGIYTGNLRNWSKRGNYRELTSDEQRKADGIRNYQQNPTPENAWMYQTPGDPNSSVMWVGDMNPYKTLLRDWTPVQQHSLSVSGGGKMVRYYFSGGFNDQEGFYRINTDQYKRYSFTSNIEAKLTERLSLGSKVSYNKSTYDAPYMVPGKGKVWTAMRNETDKNLRMPLMTGPNDPVPDTYTDNILSWMAYGAKEKVVKENLFINLNPTYKVLPELTLKGEFSYRPRTEEVSQIIPENPHIEPGDWALKTTQTTNGNQRNVNQTKSELYTINMYADFNKTFGSKHTISGVIGFNQESLKSKKYSIESTYLISSSVPSVGLSAEDKQKVKYEGYNYTTRGVFGRINYNLLDRYLFEINGRYDGSSKFTKDDRYKFFPSYSLGWRVSEESFMESTRTWLDNLKVRASYGSLGSQPSSYYPFSSLLSGGSSAGFILDGKNVVYVGAPTDLVSSTLTWEKISTFNFGLDLTVLQNRLNSSLDIFDRRTTDILMAGAEYPATLHAKAPLVNSGELKSAGWEWVIGWNDRLKNGFSYDLSFSLSDAKSKVLSYPANDDNKLLSGIYTGLINGDIWGFETDRLFQEDDFMQSADGTWGLKYEHDQSSIGGSNLFPGDVKYKDQDGDGKITKGMETLEDHGDMVLLGNSTPRFRYAITANLAYKGFDLYIFFQGVGKRDYWIDSETYRPGTGNGGSWYMLDNSWTPENTGARFPTYGANGNNWQKQSGYLVDASYLRLKQITLGYSLPKHILSKFKVEKLRTYISGYNVFEFSDVPGVFDVDQLTDEYPSWRSVSWGVQIVF